MLNLNTRQKKLLSFIEKRQKVSNSEIKDFFISIGIETTRFTIIRDLELLLDADIILKKGRGRGVYYKIKANSEILKYYDPKEYFNIVLDERNIRKEFNFNVFENFKDIFLKNEIEKLKTENRKYQNHIKSLPQTILKREHERLSIDLSWKSSQIEGNTYSLIETETLIKEMQEARGKKHEEALMILNHKKAIDYTRDKKTNYQMLTLKKVEDLHNLLTNNLQIEKGIRKSIVGITGTNYIPLDNEYQIKEAMKKLVKYINSQEEPFIKSIMAVLLVSYIQPFMDGNKRTARILGNAILLSNEICPLSYRSVDTNEYKKALLLFYEQNSARYFKELFIEQFEFAVNNYFQ